MCSTDVFLKVNFMKLLIRLDSATVKMMTKALSFTTLTTESAVMILHEQHAVLYGKTKQMITSELTKAMNTTYTKLIPREQKSYTKW